jgi:hypothetical protein
MNNASNHLKGDLRALRYLDALDAADAEAVADIWEGASGDPELERMLAELDGALFAEARGNESPLREPSGRRLRLWGARVGVAGAVAAACLIALLAWPKRDGKNTIPSPGTNQPVQPVASQPPDEVNSLSPLLALQRNPNETEMPAFIWPFENRVSTSSPLDPLD